MRKWIERVIAIVRCVQCTMRMRIIENEREREGGISITEAARRRLYNDIFILITTVP